MDAVVGGLCAAVRARAGSECKVAERGPPARSGGCARCRAEAQAGVGRARSRVSSGVVEKAGSTRRKEGVGAVVASSLPTPPPRPKGTAASFAEFAPMYFHVPVVWAYEARSARGVGLVGLVGPALDFAHPTSQTTDRCPKTCFTSAVPREATSHAPETSGGATRRWQHSLRLRRLRKLEREMWRT